MKRRGRREMSYLIKTFSLPVHTSKLLIALNIQLLLVCKEQLVASGLPSS